MQRTAVILASLVFIAFALSRVSKRTMPSCFQNLKGWQKIFGLIAFILAILVLLNPDFLALGLLGDTTFFDVLVLALSVQMLVYVQWAWRRLGTWFLKSLRWAGIPSPGLRYLLAISAVAVGVAISSIQKVVHRILS